MNIQLKNIKVAKHLSQETTAFSADVYINNVKAAYCKNDGHGGATFYWPHALEYRALITEAEQYCKTLPDIQTDFKDPGDNTKTFAIKMNLENFIDNLLNSFLGDLEKQRFVRNMERDMKKGILVGTDEQYIVYNLPKSLDDIIHTGTNPIASINEWLKKVATRMKAGDRILNTNFPNGVIIPEPVNS